MRPMGPMGLIGPMRLIGLMGPIGLIGLMSLMGCSSEEAGQVPVEEPAPIAFAGGLQEEQAVTRTPLKDLATAFTVFGFKNMDASTQYQEVFPGYRVQWRTNTAHTTTTNSDGWEYVNQQIPGNIEQTVKYWDYAASAYRFMAVTGSNVDGTVETSGPSAVLMLNFRADSDNEEGTPYYSHLWYREINSTDIGKAVKLEFLKPLCKVRFMFTFENPDDASSTELASKNFHRTDGNTIKQKGDVIVTYPLTGTEVKETMSVSGDAGGLPGLTQDYYEATSKTTVNGVEVVTSPYYGADETTLKKWYTVLPAPAGQGTFTLDVSVNGEVKTTVVPAEYMTWLPGYKYTYIFKVHVDGGVAIDNVQSAFAPWEYHEANRTVYNW